MSRTNFEDIDDCPPEERARIERIRAAFPFGTVVRAREDIWDTDEHGEDYRHAKAGDTGVVHGYCRGDDVPTVNWSAGMGRGFWDIALNEVDIVAVPMHAVIPKDLLRAKIPRIPLVPDGVLRLLAYSWRDIDYTYDLLTEAEQDCIDRWTFDALVPLAKAAYGAA